MLQFMLTVEGTRSITCAEPLQQLLFGPVTGGEDKVPPLLQGTTQSLDVEGPDLAGVLRVQAYRVKRPFVHTHVKVLQLPGTAQEVHLLKKAWLY